MNPGRRWLHCIILESRQNRRQEKVRHCNAMDWGVGVCKNESPIGLHTNMEHRTEGRYPPRFPVASLICLEILFSSRHIEHNQYIFAKQINNYCET